MCILITKSKGINMPSLRTMETCWNANPDGAGIAWSDGTKIYLKKGFMKWSDFKREYEQLNLTQFNAIIHFRIATHGTVKPENTHPFNVSDRMVAAHNGILPIEAEGDWTDSETYFRRISAPILENHRLGSNVFKHSVDATIGSSKFAFLSDKGELKMFGDFNADEDGVMYSNYSYIDYPTVYKKSKKKRGDSYTVDYSQRYGYDHFDDSYHDESYYGGYDYNGVQEINQDLYYRLLSDVYFMMEERSSKADEFNADMEYDTMFNEIRLCTQYANIEELSLEQAFEEAYEEAIESLTVNFNN